MDQQNSRVLLTPSVPEDKGLTRFILRDHVKNQTLMDSSVSNDQIPAETWYPLTFDPDWNSAGKKYILRFSAQAHQPVMG